MHYKDENTGWVYRVSPQPAERDLYFIEYLDPSNSVIFKRLPDYPGSKFKESAEEVLAARAQRNGWTPTAPLEIEPAGNDPSNVEEEKTTERHGIITPEGEFFADGAPCRKSVLFRAQIDAGRVQAVHVCNKQPSDIKIWLNEFERPETWVMNKEGTVCGEFIDLCPYCHANLKEGHGDVLFVPRRPLDKEDNTCPRKSALTGDAAVTTAESAVKLLAGAEEITTTSESAEGASTFTNLSEQATPESGALANEDENAETCCCSRCQKSDCVCAGMCDAQSRAACDGRENCSQSGCTYDVKHLKGVTYIPFAATAVDAEPVADPAPLASDSMTEATAVGDCVPMENVDGVTAVSSSDGKDIDVPTGFDYSGIEESTAAVLYNAQSIIINARKECIIKIADAVSMAHDKLVANCDNSKHSHRGENTFRAWCTSVGIGKDAAYRLLQVSTLLKNSTESELQVLEQASPSLLYAAAKPSAPAELVQAVKDGEITTHKQYKELEAQLKETQERAERAEQEAKEAKEKAHRLETRELYDANQRIKELENRPIEVATQSPTEEQINEAAKPVIQEMTAMYKVQQEQQREQIRELKAIVAASRNAIPNACRAIAESCAEAFARGFEEFQAMAQDLSDDEYMNAVEPIFEACREILDSLEGADYVEG